VKCTGVVKCKRIRAVNGKVLDQVYVAEFAGEVLVDGGEVFKSLVEWHASVW
jgi:hypothetical protein